MLGSSLPHRTGTRSWQESRKSWVSERAELSTGWGGRLTGSGEHFGSRWFRGTWKDGADIGHSVHGGRYVRGQYRDCAAHPRSSHDGVHRRDAASQGGTAGGRTG